MSPRLLLLRKVGQLQPRQHPPGDDSFRNQCHADLNSGVSRKGIIEWVKRAGSSRILPPKMVES
jgi:hypothetical protein